MKYLLILAIFLYSCNGNVFNGDSIIKVREYNENGCLCSYSTGRGWFVDSCNKFHVGDQINIQKK